MNNNNHNSNIYLLENEAFYKYIRDEAKNIFNNNDGVVEKSKSVKGVNESETALFKTLRSIYSPSYVFSNLLKDDDTEFNDVGLFYKNELMIISDKSYKDSACNAQCHWEEKFFKSDANKLKGFAKSFNQLKIAKDYIVNQKKLYFKKNEPLHLTELHHYRKVHLITRYSGFSTNAEYQYQTPNLKTTLIKNAKNGTQFLHLPNVLDQRDFYHTFDDVTFNFLINTFNTLPDLFKYINTREDVFSHYINNGPSIEIVNEELLIKGYQTKDTFWSKKFDQEKYDNHSFNDEEYGKYIFKNLCQLNDLSQIIDWIIFYLSANSQHYYFTKSNSHYPDIVEHRYALNLLSDLDRTERKTMTLSIYEALKNPYKIYGKNFKVLYLNSKLCEYHFYSFFNTKRNQLSGMTLYIMKDTVNNSFQLILTNIK
jgi:hypothetical protein